MPRPKERVRSRSCMENRGRSLDEYKDEHYSGTSQRVGGLKQCMKIVEEGESTEYGKIYNREGRGARRAHNGTRYQRTQSTHKIREDGFGKQFEYIHEKKRRSPSPETEIAIRETKNELISQFNKFAKKHKKRRRSPSPTESLNAVQLKKKILPEMLAEMEELFRLKTKLKLRPSDVLLSTKKNVHLPEAKQQVANNTLENVALTQMDKSIRKAVTHSKPHQYSTWGKHINYHPGGSNEFRAPIMPSQNEVISFLRMRQVTAIIQTQGKDRMQACHRIQCLFRRFKQRRRERNRTKPLAAALRLQFVWYYRKLLHDTHMAKLYYFTVMYKRWFRRARRRTRLQYRNYMQEKVLKENCSPVRYIQLQLIACGEGDSIANRRVVRFLYLYKTLSTVFNAWRSFATTQARVMGPFRKISRARVLQLTILQRLHVLEIQWGIFKKLQAHAYLARSSRKYLVSVFLNCIPLVCHNSFRQHQQRLTSTSHWKIRCKESCFEAWREYLFLVRKKCEWATRYFWCHDSTEHGSLQGSCRHIIFIPSLRKVYGRLPLLFSWWWLYAGNKKRKHKAMSLARRGHKTTVLKRAIDSLCRERLRSKFYSKAIPLADMKYASTLKKQYLANWVQHMRFRKYQHDIANGFQIRLYKRRHFEAWACAVMWELPVEARVLETLDQVCQVVTNSVQVYYGDQHHKWFMKRAGLLSLKNMIYWARQQRRANEFLCGHCFRRWVWYTNDADLRCEASNVLQNFFRICLARKLRNTRLRQLLMEAASRNEDLKRSVALLGQFASVIQTHMRVFLERRAKEREEKIALENKRIKGRELRKRASMENRQKVVIINKKEEKVDITIKSAATATIQRWFRGCWSRKRSPVALENNRRLSSTKKLQRFYKKRLAHRGRIATHIERWYRGVRTRLAVRMIRKYERLQSKSRVVEQGVFKVLAPVLRRHSRVGTVLTVLRMLHIIPGRHSAERTVNVLRVLEEMRARQERAIYSLDRMELRKYEKKFRHTKHKVLLKTIGTLTSVYNDRIKLKHPLEVRDLAPIQLGKGDSDRRRQLLAIAQRERTFYDAQRKYSARDKIDAAIKIQALYRGKSKRATYLRRQMKTFLRSENPLVIKRLEMFQIKGRADQVRVIKLWQHTRRKLLSFRKSKGEEETLDLSILEFKKNSKRRNAIGLGESIRRDAVAPERQEGEALTRLSATSDYFSTMVFEDAGYTFTGFWRNHSPFGYGVGSNFTTKLCCPGFAEVIGNVIQTTGIWDGTAAPSGIFKVEYDCGSFYHGNVARKFSPQDVGKLTVPSKSHAFVGYFDLFEPETNARLPGDDTQAPKTKEFDDDALEELLAGNRRWKLNEQFSLEYSDNENDPPPAEPPEPKYHLSESYYDGEWNDEGQFHGRGVLYLCNGTIYKGSFRSNQPYGYGYVEYADGSKYTGELVNCKHHGRGLFTDSTGTNYYEGHWVDGIREGYGRSWNTESREGYEGYFCEDKRHGTGTEFRGGTSIEDAEFWRRSVWELGELYCYLSKDEISRTLTETFISSLTPKDAEQVDDVYSSALAVSVLVRYERTFALLPCFRVPVQIDGEDERVQDIVNHISTYWKARKLIGKLEGVDKDLAAQIHVMDNKLDTARANLASEVALHNRMIEERFQVVGLQRYESNKYEGFDLQLDAVRFDYADRIAACELGLVGTLVETARKTLVRLVPRHIMSLTDGYTIIPPLLVRRTIGILNVIMFRSKDPLYCRETLAWCGEFTTELKKKTWKRAISFVFNQDDSFSTDFLTNGLGAIHKQWKQGWFEKDAPDEESESEPPTNHFPPVSYIFGDDVPSDVLRAIISSILDPHHDPDRVLREGGDHYRSEILNAIWNWIHAWYAACSINEALRDFQSEIGGLNRDRDETRLRIQDLNAEILSMKNGESRHKSKIDRWSKEVEVYSQQREELQTRFVLGVGNMSMLHEFESFSEDSVRLIGDGGSDVPTFDWTPDDLAKATRLFSETKEQYETMQQEVLDLNERIKELIPLIPGLQAALDLLERRRSPTMQAAEQKLAQLSAEHLLGMFELGAAAPMYCMMTGRVLSYITGNDQPTWQQARDLFVKKYFHPRTGKRIIEGDISLIQTLLDIDKDALVEGKAFYIQQTIEKHYLEPSSIEGKMMTYPRNAREGMVIICQWINAIDLYCSVGHTVNPLKKRSSDAKQEVAQHRERLTQLSTEMTEEKKLLDFRTTMKNVIKVGLEIRTMRS